MNTRMMALMTCAAVATVLLAAGARAADVFNMGGTRNPDGSWTGLASLETVHVGNPGNAADCTGYGAVGYAYNIGKYEVTAWQYCEFLNAVAKAYTYGLYNAAMADPVAWGGCNIQRSDSSCSYTYSVDPNWASRPVNYVSRGDAARFANWLHNGQPTGAQNSTTTEDGAYYLNPSRPRPSSRSICSISCRLSMQVRATSSLLAGPLCRPAARWESPHLQDLPGSLMPASVVGLPRDSIRTSGISKQVWGCDDGPSGPFAGDGAAQSGHGRSVRC